MFAVSSIFRFIREHFSVYFLVDVSLIFCCISKHARYLHDKIEQILWSIFKRLAL